MLDVFGLIHMNGRVYDPQIGRFLQADVLLDAGIQGLNRYSYVLNNPLSLTDPSGHMSVGQILRTVAAIAITVYTGGTAAGLLAENLVGQALAVAMAGGFAAGAIQSGTLKGALTGAYTSMAFFAVGSYFKAAEWASKGGKLTSIGRTAKIVAHGVVGGVSSELQGASFGSGFVSAGFSEMAGPLTENLDSDLAQAAASALVGGTASRLSGGKFANGAVTAAMGWAFNRFAHGEGANDTSENEPEELSYDRKIDWSLIGDDDLLGKAGERALNEFGFLPEGHVTVLAHAGGTDTIYDNRSAFPFIGPDGTNLSNWQAERFAHMLQRQFPQLRPGMTVVLAACTTGGNWSRLGVNNLAQGVANRLGVTVIAPDLWLRVDIATGYPHIVHKSQPGVTGRWVTHTPRN